MERKIGEIFEYEGEWYQCIIGHCNQCCFDEAGICKFIGDPYCAYRNDKKLACFKKLEKIGEPFYRRWTLEGNNKLMQRYKTYTTPLITIDKQQIFYNLTDDLLEIEIKQNKEDMGEKKQKLDDLVGLYSSAQITYKEFDKELKALYTKQWEEDKPVLKPFNLEEAKEGKPVCTRDGRKARIICFDLKNEDNPIVAAIVNHSIENLFYYTKNGKLIDGIESDEDLMMLPEKKEGWVNVYKDGLLDTKSYPTKKEAFDKASPKDYVDTIKINWSE